MGGTQSCDTVQSLYRSKYRFFMKNQYYVSTKFLLDSTHQAVDVSENVLNRLVISFPNPPVKGECHEIFSPGSQELNLYTILHIFWTKMKTPQM